MKLPDDLSAQSIECDGDQLGAARRSTFIRSDQVGSWKPCSPAAEIDTQSPTQYLRVADILNTSLPITLVYQQEDPHTFRIALRLSRVLSLYLRIDTNIVSAAEWEEASLTKGPRTNVVVLSKGPTALPQGSISANHMELNDQGLKIHGRTYRAPRTGALILCPTETNTALYIWGNDDHGLERAARLFPFRTGLSCPEWIVLGDAPGEVLAAGFWGHEWMPWNEAMSWLS